jgi:hypothetical protein
MSDAIEADIRAGAIAALRRRAERQRKRAADWTITGDRGAIIRSGEGAIALRIAEALDQAADELDAEAGR